MLYVMTRSATHPEWGPGLVVSCGGRMCLQRLEHSVSSPDPWDQGGPEYQRLLEDLYHHEDLQISAMGIRRVRCTINVIDLKVGLKQSSG